MKRSSERKWTDCWAQCFSAALRRTVEKQLKFLLFKTSNSGGENVHKKYFFARKAVRQKISLFRGSDLFVHVIVLGRDGQKLQTDDKGIRLIRNPSLLFPRANKALWSRTWAHGLQTKLKPATFDLVHQGTLTRSKKRRCPASIASENLDSNKNCFQIAWHRLQCVHRREQNELVTGDTLFGDRQQNKAQWNNETLFALNKTHLVLPYLHK